MLYSIISTAGLSIFFAAILAIADKKLRVVEDPRIEKVTRLLPGVNCGACGFLSCNDFATHIIKEASNPSKCRVASDESRKQIFEIAGHAGGADNKVFPLINCSATFPQKKNSAEYVGIKKCSSANLIFGSGMDCEYGCMGFGDCVSVCPFDALHMIDGLPCVTIEKCTGCGKCATVCPRKIISMVEKKFENIFFVACSSHDSMGRTRKVCDVGCIACGVCVKLGGNESFFNIENNLSIADYTKQNNAEPIKVIQSKCPTKVIKIIA
ncbi:RnfABCDGE type electron transport complex subunit B [Candidatus Omnitrophus magneticus]|uniref:Ion-translocating oxidoreductase complex subunit B n=1 Tax=Candidatus Omnitrophus magneticus TaxID=1609969 RepID=A0A0F0CNC1_9BACT|nr:RnfABCDGE type electron transport complex subunit B [Candidatus Omnitrophus magneticus]